MFRNPDFENLFGNSGKFSGNHSSYQRPTWNRSRPPRTLRKTLTRIQTVIPCIFSAFRIQINRFGNPRSFRENPKAFGKIRKFSGNYLGYQKPIWNRNRSHRTLRKTPIRYSDYNIMYFERVSNPDFENRFGNSRKFSGKFKKQTIWVIKSKHGIEVNHPEHFKRLDCNHAF